MGMYVNGAWVDSPCPVSCTDCQGVHIHYFTNNYCQSLCVTLPIRSGYTYGCGYCSEIDQEPAADTPPLEVPDAGEPTTSSQDACTPGAMGMYVANGEWMDSRCPVSCTDCPGAHVHYFVNSVCQSMCVTMPTLASNDSYECGYCSEINASSVSQEQVPSDGQQDSSGLILRAVMANVIAVVVYAILAFS